MNECKSCGEPAEIGLDDRNPVHDEDAAFYEALVDAREAFNETLDRYGFDPAYFSLRLTGRVLYSVGGEVKREVVDKDSWEMNVDDERGDGQ